MNKDIKLATAFAFMACDGNISQEEVAALSEKFGNGTDGQLQEMVADLNARGKEYILDFLRGLEDAGLGKEEAMELLKIGVDTIFADNNVEYSEIKFFRLVRSKFETVSDEEILASDSRVEDFWLEKDLTAENPESAYFASGTGFASLSLPNLELGKKK